MSPAFEGRLRTPRMLPPDAIVSRDDRGRLRVRSPHALGPYPATLTHCLAHWAERAPDRTFLAARRLDGSWERLTYAGRARAHARGRAGAARSRPLGRSADRDPLRQQPRARRARPRRDVRGRAVRADRAVLLAARRRTTARSRAVVAAMRPGLIFAADGARFDRALAEPGAAGRRRGRHRQPGPGRAPADQLRRAPRHHGDRGGRRRARARRARHRRQGALHVGVDGRAEGRHQHAAHALPPTRSSCGRCWRSSPTSRRCSATGCRGTTRSAATTTSA